MSRRVQLAAVALGLALAAQPAAAQERKHLILHGIASGTVAPNGLGFISLSGTNKSPADKTDGSLAFGLGFGSAEETIGVQVTAQVTSLTDDFGDSGFMQLKLSRRLGDQPLYFAIQGDHLANWGDSRDIDPSFKVAFSYFTALRTASDAYPVMLTLGGGDKVHDFGREAGVFGGIGIGITPVVGASLAYTGDYWDIGTGFRLGDDLRLNVSLDDAFDQRDRRRVTVSVTYLLRNLFGG